MMTPTRIIRMIGIAGLVGWMILVGWVAKTSQAQNGAQDATTLPGPTEPSSLTPVAAEMPKDKEPAPPALGAELPCSRAAEPSVSPNPAAPPALATMPPQEESRAVQPPNPRNPTDTQPASPSDDPEQAARSFVERNQKEAEEHLKALTTEAQQLRTRLAKLEAGIKKWQGLVNALKTSQDQAMTSTVVMPGADEAGDLEPVKPGGKSDKRVKWATATSTGNAADAQQGGHIEPAQQPPPVPQPQPLPVAVPSAVPR